MRELIIASGETVLLDDEDYDKVSTRRWKVRCLRKGHRIYRTAVKKGNSPLVYFILNTSWSEVGVVEYVDGNFLNNQKDNLLIVTDITRKQRRKDGRARYIQSLNEQQLASYKSRRASASLKFYYKDVENSRRRMVARWIARGRPATHKTDLSATEWNRRMRMASDNALRYRRELHDYYLKSKILQATPELTRAEITPEMVEIQRKILKLHRHVKQENQNRQRN